MNTNCPTTKLLTALTAAVLSLGAAPAVAQTSTVYRSSTMDYYYWFPTFTQPIYIDLVGHGLNGRSFNGKLLDGHTVVAVKLDGVQLQSGQQKDLTLVDTLFGLDHGQDKNQGKNAPKLAKSQAVAAPGLVFHATLDDGDDVLLRIDSVEPATTGPNSYLRYVVTYASESGWVPLCGTDESGNLGRAVPLNGRWNYEQGVSGGGDFVSDDDIFTFACEGHVLAKCVAMGYPPWANGKLCDADGKHCTAGTLAPWHQACTRLLRADFCGDGTSWTLDGTGILVRDGVGIRGEQDQGALEAEWDENGARCAVRERITTDLEPPCMAALALPTCGDPANMSSGTRLVSEIPL